MTLTESLKKAETEWYSDSNGRVIEFDNVNQAKYRMKKLNAEIVNEPMWELYTTFRKPMLKRVWKE